MQNQELLFHGSRISKITAPLCASPLMQIRPMAPWVFREAVCPPKIKNFKKIKKTQWKIKNYCSMDQEFQEFHLTPASPPSCTSAPLWYFVTLVLWVTLGSVEALGGEG